MRWMKPIGSLVMALLIGVTSLGMTVSAHTCSESGHSETSLKPIRPCCKQVEGHGFRAEPCCKLSVQHVKLATVRLSVSTVQVPMALQWATLPSSVLFGAIPEPALMAFSPASEPPESPPLANGRAIQTHFCSHLI